MMKSPINRLMFLILTISLLTACGFSTSESADRSAVDSDSLPAKAPQERTEALDTRQTEWSQTTYAETPPDDSLQKEIADSSQLKQE